MTLEEAFQRLQLQPPLDWERNVLAGHAASFFPGDVEENPVRIGTTTHMLIELALDWMAFRKKFGTDWYKVEKVDITFVLLCEFPESMVCLLDSVFEVVGETHDVDVLQRWQRLKIATPSDIRSRLGRRRLGLGISKPIWYIDHHCINPKRRLTGPYRLIRRLQWNKDGEEAVAYGRGTRELFEIDVPGAKEVVSLSPAPVAGSANIVGDPRLKILQEQRGVDGLMRVFPSDGS